jgi:16S rRNA (guanine966-N2)-methyltransferase
MRVIAGSARGRAMIAPPGHKVRPTADRVRQAVFNALTSRGFVDDVCVVDLFAGTGALGIEALSRGASHATFVEQDKTAVDHIRANLDFLDFASKATIVRMEVLRWLPSLPTDTDVVLADPPYTFTEWAALLTGLLPVLRATDGIVVAETQRSLDPVDGWEVEREHRYGGTVITMLRPSTPASQANATDLIES